MHNVAKIGQCTLVNHDIERADFNGIILIVDSDMSAANSFDAYKRNPLLPYSENDMPDIDNKGGHYQIDRLNGAKQIPIYGINVPICSTGFLETDLLGVSYMAFR